MPRLGDDQPPLPIAERIEGHLGRILARLAKGDALERRARTLRVFLRNLYAARCRSRAGEEREVALVWTEFDWRGIDTSGRVEKCRGQCLRPRVHRDVFPRDKRRRQRIFVLQHPDVFGIEARRISLGKGILDLRWRERIFLVQQHMRNPRNPHVSLHGGGRRIRPIDERPHAAQLEMAPGSFAVEPAPRLHRCAEVKISTGHRIDPPLDKRGLEVILRTIEIAECLFRQTGRKELRKISRRIEQQDYAEQTRHDQPVTLLDERIEQLLQRESTSHRGGEKAHLPESPRSADVAIHGQLLHEHKPRDEKIDQDEHGGPQPSPRPRREDCVNKKRRDASHEPHQGCDPIRRLG